MVKYLVELGCPRFFTITTTRSLYTEHITIIGKLKSHSKKYKIEFPVIGLRTNYIFRPLKTQHKAQIFKSDSLNSQMHTFCFNLTELIKIKLTYIYFDFFSFER